MQSESLQQESSPLICTEQRTKGTQSVDLESRIVTSYLPNSSETSLAVGRLTVTGKQQLETTKITVVKQHKDSQLLVCEDCNPADPLNTYIPYNLSEMGVQSGSVQNPQEA